MNVSSLSFKKEEKEGEGKLQTGLPDVNTWKDPRTDY